MKLILTAMVLFSSLSALAGSNCSNLLGTYQCDLGGDKYELNIFDLPSGKVRIELAGNGDNYRLNGELEDSINDDSQNIAICTDKGDIFIENFFKDEKKGEFTYSLTDQGILKVEMVKGPNRKLSLSCQ